MPRLDKDELRQQTERNCELLKSEAFLEQLDAILNAPEGERIDEAARRLTPKALRSAGVELPKGVRVSSRYFESRLKRPLEFGDVEERVNAVTALAEISPGVLEKMHSLDPDVLERINIPGRAELPGRGDVGPLAACAGVGVRAGVGVCACFGS